MDKKKENQYHRAYEKMQTGKGNVMLKTQSYALS